MKRIIALIIMALTVMSTGFAEESMNTVKTNTVHFDYLGAFESGAKRHIGDVHPFYWDGKLYMFYLRTDGSFSSELLVSTDFVSFEPVDITRTSPLPTIDSYYVLRVQPYRDLFVSYFGASREVINGSISDDLVTWKRIDALYPGTLPSMTYPKGGRDPYLFFDTDINRWRIIHNAIYENAAGRDFDTALALVTSKTERLEDGWEDGEIELLRFDNAGSSRCEDPECPQAMKIADRWYIFASLYSRTSHGVGGLSYWKGEAGKALTENDWPRIEEESLDGEDICAAQLVEVENRLYMYGWVPQNADGGGWGGALSIAREVYPLPDGDLATRLPDEIRKTITGPTILELDGDIRLEGVEKKYCFGKYANYALDGRYSHAGLHMTLDISEDSKAGIALKCPASRYVYLIYVDRAASMMYICTKVGAEYRVRAQRALQIDDWSSVDLTVLLDGNIADAFINDRFSLCARLSGTYTLDDAELELFADGTANFESVRATDLKTPDKLND